MWTYGYFEVDGPETNYTLHIGQAQGPSDGYNSMAEHNGMQFSTTDRPRVATVPASLEGVSYDGGSGWWFKDCHHSLLTGAMVATVQGGYNWRTGHNTVIFYSFAEMKLHPKSCKTIEDQSCN